MATLDSTFRRVRTRNWVLLGLLYALFYMSRYNYAVAAPRLAEAFHWKNAELGVFGTAMPLVYGLSVFLNGPVADKIGGKRAFLFGTVGAAAMNVAFGGLVRHALGEGAATPAVFWLLVVTWGMNGFFQSFGALSIVKVNAQWFHVSERGTFAGIFGVLIRFGLILAFGVSPKILQWSSVEWVFWVPALLLGAFFVLNLLFMYDTPAEAGLGDFDTGDVEEAGPARAQLLDVLKRVFTSRAAWTVAGASVMIGFVRRSTIDDWYPKYFVDNFHVPAKQLGDFAPYEIAAWGIAIAGILGGFAFGIASDRRFGSRRGPVITIGFLGMSAVLVLLGLVHRWEVGALATSLLLVTISFFVNGAHGMIGGAASMDFGGRKGAATAAGLFDGMQYLMTAIPTGYGMGKLVDHYGWGAWNFAFAPFAVLGALLAATLWNARPGRSAHGAPSTQEAKAAAA